MKRKWKAIIVIFIVVAIVLTIYFVGTNTISTNDKIADAKLTMIYTENKGVDSETEITEIKLDTAQLEKLNTSFDELRLYKSFFNTPQGSGKSFVEYRLVVKTAEGNTIEHQFSDVFTQVKIIENGGNPKLYKFTPFGSIDNHQEIIRKHFMYE